MVTKFLIILALVITALVASNINKMSLKVYSFIQRFVKGFVAGGLVQMGVMLHAGVTVTTLADLKKFGLALVAAFFVGGLLATEKMVTWKE